MNSLEIDPNLQDSLDLSREVWAAMTDSRVDPSEVSLVIQSILENASFTCASALTPGPSPEFAELGEVVEIGRLEQPEAIVLEEVESEETDCELEIEEEGEEFSDSEISDSDDGPQENLDLTFLSYSISEAGLFPLESFRKTLEKGRTEESFHPEALALLERIAFEIEIANLGTTIKPFDFLIRSLFDRPVTDEDLSELESLLVNFTQKRLQTTHF